MKTPVKTKPKEPVKVPVEPKAEMLLQHENTENLEADKAKQAGQQNLFNFLFGGPK